MMNWYFGLSEASIDRQDHGWCGLIRVAVRSARQNTSLVPHMLYDGAENEFIKEISDAGVRVIRHRVSFYDRLQQVSKTRPGYLAIASGAFLRVEIPLIETQSEFALYTDCDVMFGQSLNLRDIKPANFAAAPQFSQTDYDNDMNTGVMVMNIASLRQSLPEFTHFIHENLNAGWPGCDQEHYRRFYKGQYSSLPTTLNWKPYWGINEDAGIVHWHGPKPLMARRLVMNPDRVTNSDWKKLFATNPRAYEHYIAVWDAFSDGIPKTLFGHLDVLESSGGAGWVLDGDDCLRPVSLSVFVDGERIAAMNNGAARADLQRIYSSDIGGFTFQLPTRFCDGGRHTVAIHDERDQPIQLKYLTGLSRQFEFS